jgi:hypothetical protein
VTSSGAKVAPEAAAAPKGGEEAAPGSGALPPTVFKPTPRPGGTVTFEGQGANLSPGVIQPPPGGWPLPPPRPANLGQPAPAPASAATGSPAPAVPPPRPAGLGAPAAAIPPGATALAPGGGPAAIPQNLSALYQGRTRLDQPGAPSALIPSAMPVIPPNLAVPPRANVPAARAQPVSAMAPPGAFAGGPLSFLSGLPIVGGLFGGGQGPQLSAGGNQVAGAVIRPRRARPASGRLCRSWRWPGFDRRSARH